MRITRLRWPHAVTIALSVFALLNLFGTHIATEALPASSSMSSTMGLEDYRVTALWWGKWFLEGRAGVDSWYPMQVALEHTRAAEEDTIYQAVFFKQRIRFQYPPSSLLPLELLDRVSRWLAGKELSFALLNRISWYGVFFLAAVVPITYVLALLKFSPELAGRFSRFDLVWQAVVVGCMTMTFYPITRAFGLGQIQTWLTCLFACSVLAWVTGRRATAGVFIGLIASIKPQLALLLLWGAFRGQWRFLSGSVAALATVQGIALWLYGFRNHLDYLSALSFMSAHGESYFANQSVNGMLARMLHIGNNLTWLEGVFPPFHPLVYATTLTTSLIMIGFALFWRRTSTDEQTLVLSFLLAALLFTIASPIAWDQHYGILAPVYFIFLAILLKTRRPRWLIWTAASYVLASNVFLVTNFAANTRWNFVQNYLLGAAILLILTIYRHHRSTEAASAVKAGERIAFVQQQIAGRLVSREHAG